MSKLDLRFVKQLLTLMIVSYLFFSLIITSLFFLFGLDITWYHLPISLLCSFTLTFCFSYRNIKNFGFSVLLFLFICLVSFFLSINFYDVSWDGMGYHQETIVKLANGWNPFKEQIFDNRYNASVDYAQWINYYQKGIEINQAVIYKFFGKIEAGKLVNFLLFFATALLSFDVLSLFIKNFLSMLLLTVLVIFCPIVSVQLFTYFIDLIYYLSLLITLCSIILFIHSTDKKYLYLFGFMSVVLCSMKFSTLPTFGLLVIASLLYILREKKQLFKPFFFSGVFIFFCTVLTNYHPFITNIQNDKHIFHPILGKEKVETIISTNTPREVMGKSKLAKLYYSTISESSSRFIDNEKKPFKTKLPFTLNRSEFEDLHWPALRLSGFGPLFSGASLVSIIILLAYPFFLKKTDHERKKKAGIVYYILFFILLSVFVNPELWWARFVPQLWLVPVLALCLVWNFPVNFFRYSKYLLFFTLFYNAFLMSYAAFDFEHRATRKIKNQLKTWKDTNATFIIDEKVFFRTHLRFEENGIKYELGEIKEGEHSRVMPFTFGNVKVKMKYAK